MATKLRYTILYCCCLALLIVPVFLMPSYGLQPDLSFIRLLKFLFSAAAGIGAGLLLLMGGASLGKVAIAKAGTGIVAAGMVTTLALVAASVLKPDAADIDARKERIAAAIPQLEELPSASEIARDGDNLPEVKMAQREQPDDLQPRSSRTTTSTAKKPAEAKPSALELMGQTAMTKTTTPAPDADKKAASEKPAAAPPPAIEQVRIRELQDMGYSVSAWLPKGTAITLNRPNRMTPDINALNGQLQPGLRTPWVLVASDDHPTFDKGRAKLKAGQNVASFKETFTSRSGMTVWTIVREKTVQSEGNFANLKNQYTDKELQYSGELTGYMVEYWIFHPEYSDDLFKLYSPKVYRTAKEAAAAKDLRVD